MNVKFHYHYKISLHGQENYPSPKCLNQLWVHPASYVMGRQRFFLGEYIKWGSEADHSRPSSAEVKYSSAYIPSIDLCWCV